MESRAIENWAIVEVTLGNKDSSKYLEKFAEDINTNLKNGFEFDGDIQVSTCFGKGDVIKTMVQRMVKYKSVNKLTKDEVEEFYKKAVDKIYYNRSSILQDEAYKMLTEFKRKILGNEQA